MRRGVSAVQAGILASVAALVAAGLAAPQLTQPAEASVGTSNPATRVAGDDTVLGTFTSVGGGANGTVYALALQGDDTLYAGGSFTSAGGRSDDSYIAALSLANDTWHPLGGGVKSEVRSLAMQGDDTLYAGQFCIVSFSCSTDLGGAAGTNAIVAWSMADGNWHAVGGGMVGTVLVVSALTVQGDDTVYAGGGFDSAGGVADTVNFAAWANTDDTWHPVSGGVQGNSVLALALQGDDSLYAGGFYSSAGGVADTSNIAVWSNADDTWHAVGGGVGNSTRALVAQGDDTLFAGGAFTDAGGQSGASRIARWSNVDDTWHAVGGGISGGFRDVAALALDDTRGLLYAGGSFGSAGSAAATNVAVWDVGISAWIPLQAAAGQGVGSSVYGLALDDSVVYLGGAFATAGGVSVNRVARWTWDAPSVEAVPASGAAGALIDLEGSGLIGVTRVRLDGSPVNYTRDDSTTISVSIPGGVSAGAHTLQVDAVGGTATTTYTVSGSPSPAYPPGAPTGVVAVAGDGLASVSWVAPADVGSFPVSAYEATSSPGGSSCLVSAPTLTCTVSGLVNGTSYTFSVRALNGAGWGAESARSNAVTPRAMVRPTIVITGSRDPADPRMAVVRGVSTGLAGEQVTPYVRFAGEGEFTPGRVTRPVATDGTFDWQRRTARRVVVYFACGAVVSNRVVIPAR